MKAGLLYHDDFLRHDTGGHVENSGRLTAIMKAFDESKLKGSVERLEPRAATNEEINLIHPPSHVDYIEMASARGGGWLDGDTVASAESARVARLAAGGAVEAAEAVLKRGYDWIF